MMKSEREVSIPIETKINADIWYSNRDTLYLRFLREDWFKMMDIIWRVNKSIMTNSGFDPISPLKRQMKEELSNIE